MPLPPLRLLGKRAYFLFEKHFSSHNKFHNNHEQADHPDDDDDDDDDINADEFVMMMMIIDYDDNYDVKG